MARGYNLHANGIRQHLLHYAGEGPQMLLIPGITSPAITWGFVAERLAEKFDVHVLDVRGRGLSQAGDLNYSLDAMAEDALGVIDAGDMDRPVILGHSMGARNAIRAARKNSDAMSGLILVDPPVSGPSRRAYPAKWQWYEDSIIAATKGCSAEEMRAFCPTWTNDQVGLRAEWLHTCQLDAIKTAYDGFHTDDIHADLPHIKLPMRLLKAGNAPVIGEDDITEIQSLAPHIEVKVVQDAGHMIPWDNLEGFLDAVMNFSEDA
ncbi:N-formylmaleamate deformylase [Loktanella sp. PT4BL]|jgi:N-formylmaleamate deformylase|uniref:N-formylmaleamate deformylase n=1 Tax=Yoonia vestfoldensis TaxID=245188 RepID=A0A1Y0EFV0_9RHOB|nr:MULTISPECIES: alpha/beta hydrolase [Rhodobacterales]ARU02514.1 N-formylmaleamate deformylase [Yoonia vestfoldensis]PXW66306.1 N-formylmaleamate deformylase [Loktanella sp. PT4BL]HEV8036482.1 alpha/beta hydrolase [Yoonia sp.]